MKLELMLKIRNTRMTNGTASWMQNSDVEQAIARWKQYKATR